jgi:hypothetical protein
MPNVGLPGERFRSAFPASFDQEVPDTVPTILILADPIGLEANTQNGIGHHQRRFQLAASVLAGPNNPGLATGLTLNRFPCLWLLPLEFGLAKSKSPDCPLCQRFMDNS